MKKENRVLMTEARAALSGKWRLAIGGFILSELVSIGTKIVPFVNLIVPILISGSMVLGLAVFYLTIARHRPATVGQVFDGFKKFGTAFGIFILTTIFTFLWTLLLIIPGVIAALSYSQAFFILADNPDIGPMEAIRRSKKMMYGHKWKLFCLGWRFFGWSILGVLTLGIGFLWIFPYMMVSYAKFYDDIKEIANVHTKKESETVEAPPKEVVTATDKTK